MIALWVSMKGGMVEVGKMIGSADPANGSAGGAAWETDKVGVGTTPQRDGVVPQAAIVMEIAMRMAKCGFMLMGLYPDKTFGDLTGDQVLGACGVKGFDGIVAVRQVAVIFDAASTGNPSTEDEG